MISTEEFQKQTTGQPRKLENFRILPETKAFIAAFKAENRLESEGKALDYILHTYPLLLASKPVSEAVSNENESRIQQLTQALEAAKAESEQLKATIGEIEHNNQLLQQAADVMLQLTTILEPVRTDAEKLFSSVLFKEKPTVSLSHIDVAELLVDYAYRDPSTAFPDMQKANAIYERAKKQTNEATTQKKLTITHKAENPTANKGSGATSGEPDPECGPQ